MIQPIPKSTSNQRWTARELRQLPADQCDAILRAAAADAEDAYRSNAELTSFEAFGREDLHIDCAFSGTP